ncbi:MAG: N-acetylmuramic acid 6-phosphate etherase [Pseudomonadota bacterium]
MPKRVTEQLHKHARGLDRLALADAAVIMAEGQIAASKAVLDACPDIANAAEAMAKCITSGGKLYYVAAGSSGLMAAADAMELGGTFGITADRVVILMAGGLPTSAEMPGGTEDDNASLEAELADLTPGDLVISASASGSTPYTVEAARLARVMGTPVIGIANAAGSSLLALADIPILLETPPEVLSGSTRMGAGTAQKIALNMMSTLMAISLGHIHDGMMVNLRPDNAKLRMRARDIVAQIAGVDSNAADQALTVAHDEVKPAALLAAGAKSADAARELLDHTGGNLRQALSDLKNIKTKSIQQGGSE